MILEFTGPMLQAGLLSTEWTADNPILEERRLGFETDSLKFKLGDGVTAWNDLDYAGTISWDQVTDKPEILTELAALTPTANQIFYYTGATTVALASLTAFARSIIDDADAAAVRTTLGLDTAATMAGPAGAIVGTSDTQTLTNKTLAAATLTGITTLPGSGQIDASGFITIGASGGFNLGSKGGAPRIDYSGGFRFIDSGGSFTRILAASATLSGLPTYANDAAAGTGGLTAGQLYKTSDGASGFYLKIKA